MVYVVGEWYHLANSRPVGTEAAVGGEDVNPFEFHHRNVLRPENLILAEDLVETFPGFHEFFLSTYGILSKGDVLEPL